MSASSSSTTRSVPASGRRVPRPSCRLLAGVAVADDHVPDRPVDRSSGRRRRDRRPSGSRRAAPRPAARDRRPTSTTRTRPGSAPCRGISRTCTPVARRAPRRASAGRPARGTRRASSARPGVTTSTRPASSARQRSAIAAACSNAQAGRASSAASRPASDAGRPPVRIEARGARLRLEAPVRLVAGLREVARRRDPQPLGIGDDECARRVRAAEPLLARDREVVEPGGVDGDRADRLGPVDEHRHAGLCAQLAHGQHATGRPQHLRQRQQPRPRRHRGPDRVRVGLDDDDARRRRRRAHRAGRNARRRS